MQAAQCGKKNGPFDHPRKINKGKKESDKMKMLSTAIAVAAMVLTGCAPSQSEIIETIQNGINAKALEQGVRGMPGATLDDIYKLKLKRVDTTLFPVAEDTTHCTGTIKYTVSMIGDPNETEFSKNISVVYKVDSDNNVTYQWEVEE